MGKMIMKMLKKKSKLTYRFKDESRNTKDIAEEFNSVHLLDDTTDHYGRLREAAKEWMDYVDCFEPKRYPDEKGFDRDINFHYYHRELLVTWIKHFFNLEDD